MAKVIMVQGTMSNVGKSIVAAGLCRAFAEDGYRVAPFKSQNMALNSYVTKEGLEMGRAQAVQAECCGRRPEVSMNPILLKPTTDMGSQIIVNGRPIGNMGAREYFAYKKKLIPEIMAAFEKLNQENDILVVEGAGSPAELNLKSDDIVNMGLARLIQAPVLLVGDINPGGIFAQLYGTVSLLEPEEQSMIRGLIINKFRGDKEILRPGLSILEEKCQLPVLGVLPYHSLDIEEEDSMSRRLVRRGEREAYVRIGVVHLPHISNYTDFMPLEILEHVDLQYISKPEELEQVDWIILPGTKNTLQDLKWLHQTGMAAKIKRQYSKGSYVSGICGGYQILGKRVVDELGAEGMGTQEGLGIFPIVTQFSMTKCTRQSKGRLRNAYIFAGQEPVEVEGYEIHMGQSYFEDEGESLMATSDGDRGCLVENGFGTYFHGIFENASVVDCILQELCKRKGMVLQNTNAEAYQEYKQLQYHKLGAWIRENLDMKQIYDILWKGL